MQLIIGLAIFFGALIIMILVIFIKANLKICEPNEIMIFSGRKYKDKAGNVIGYRIIKGGRALKMPLMESVSTLSLNTIPIEMDMTGALTLGTVPVNVKAMANVKIAGNEEEGLPNAIERFLSKSPLAIGSTAKEIIEGTIRGVIATMQPEEANAGRLLLAQKVCEDAREDLIRMGLVLDTLKILQISDGKGYLEAIARKKNAEVQRDARIVEAESNAQAVQKESESKKASQIADIDANRSIIEADQRLRAEKAKWTAEANIEEEKAELAREVSRMDVMTSIEEKKVKVNEMKYQAEVVVPAEAEKQALMKRAAGKAAYTFEEGKAKADALQLLRAQWDKEGSKDLFLIQLLPEIVEEVSKVISSNLTVEKLTVVDGSGNGNGIPHLVGSLAGSVNAFMEQIKTMTGIDIPQIMENKQAS